MGFAVEKISKARMKPVHADLVRVFYTYANDTRSGTPLTRVTCGLRTIEEQRVLVRLGKSRTLKSRHLPQKDGLSHAFDVVTIDEHMEADWSDLAFYRIAELMRDAARECAVDVVWGGIWDKPLRKVEGPIETAYLNYVMHFRAANGRSPFKDFPHFQLGV